MATKDELCRLLAAMSNMRDDGSWDCPSDLQKVVDEMKSDTAWDFMDNLQKADLKETIRSNAEKISHNIMTHNPILRKMKGFTK